MEVSDCDRQHCGEIDILIIVINRVFTKHWYGFKHLLVDL